MARRLRARQQLREAVCLPALPGCQTAAFPEHRDGGAVPLQGSTWPNSCTPAQQRLNEAMQAYAEAAPRVHWLDVGEAFLTRDATGRQEINPMLLPDTLHPSLKGMQVGPSHPPARALGLGAHLAAGGSRGQQPCRKHVAASPAGLPLGSCGSGCREQPGCVRATLQGAGRGWSCRADHRAGAPAQGAAAVPGRGGGVSRAHAAAGRPHQP